MSLFMGMHLIQRFRYYWLGAFLLFIYIAWLKPLPTVDSEYCHDSLEMAYQYSLQAGDVDSAQNALILCLESSKTCCKHFLALMKRWKAADPYFLGCAPTYCKTQYFEGESCPSYMHDIKVDR